MGAAIHVVIDVYSILIALIPGVFWHPSLLFSVIIFLDCKEHKLQSFPFSPKASAGNDLTRRQVSSSVFHSCHDRVYSDA